MVQTGDTVKSCAAVHEASGVAVFGSHDGRVRAIDVLTQRCLWTYPPHDTSPLPHGSASVARLAGVLSSPSVDETRGRVVVADLRGVVSCLALPTPRDAQPLLVWARDLYHPVFSSIAICPNGMRPYMYACRMCAWMCLKITEARLQL